MRVREIVVFSGTAHRGLAEDVCAALGVELSPVEITRFSNDCLQVQLQANCRQRDVYLVQPLVPPTQDALMELLLMLDAARVRRRRRSPRSSRTTRTRGRTRRMRRASRSAPGSSRTCWSRRARTGCSP
ncbi:hypothetical protein GCM10025864_13200 [Luteimicrobium album]|uniref:ribose-phosphate diphosphokinase n=1 Tax=Luteimicrobium album TaxID=1054550 RepID=A0ABQ6HYI5_9MICO|nr:hypothetical protein GCM10025864_13200 [Luteimicrobium album]